MADSTSPFSWIAVFLSWSPLVCIAETRTAPPGIDLSVESRNKGSNLLLSGAAVLLNLVDGTIHGGDGLQCLFLSIRDGDGIAGNLVLEWAGDLAQGAEDVARVHFAQTPGTNGFSAGLAVGVDFHADVFLAAGNSLHAGISGKGLVKGDLLVHGRHLPPFVNT